MNYIFALLIAVFPYTFGAPLDTAVTDCLPPKYRLSGNVKPSFYSIKIHPNLQQETFTGEVFIHVTVGLSVDAIEFHSSQLSINSIYFNSVKVQYIPDVGYCNLAWDELGYEFLEYEIIRIKYGNKSLIPPGSHVIHITYNGTFSKRTEGIFKAGFSKNGTLLSYLVATDFEPHWARRVFPCFDEPALKAKFQLSLVVPDKTYTALSNMNTTKVFETSYGVIYNFATTPPMSTYLLSFVISQHTCNEYVDRIPYRICSYDGKNQNTTKLLEFASKTIKFYEEYTTVNYTLPKIDFVGFDRNESAATENWGLITLNSSLTSPYDDFYYNSQKLTVIAHELAHFWFGNLVTNDWWDGIWLQEGLATFMSIKVEDYYLNGTASKHFPEVYMDNLFWYDRIKNSTPVINFQVVPTKVRENFNDITYEKAAAILRMLEAVMGEELFRQTIIEYVKEYAFKTASSEDFVSVVTSRMPHVNLREFLESYLYQDKYPVILVEETKDKYVLKQRSCQPQNAESPLGYKWTIPVSYITDSNKIPETLWMYKDMENLTLPKPKKWIKFNYKQIGYYRVNYTDTLWQTFMNNMEDLETYERDLLLLEAGDLFLMDLVSCDTVLKYALELACYVTKGSPINVDYGLLVYAKVSDKITGHDAEAHKNLRSFFGLYLELGRKKRLANFFANNDIFAARQTTKTTENISAQTKSCIDWLKSESMEYFYKRTETDNDTYKCVLN